MSVVNVKVKFIRPQYQNLKEWVQDKNNVYIGRRGIVFIEGKRFPNENSIFANPFKIKKNQNREEVIKKYELHIRIKIKENPNLKKILINMKDKNIGCWCHPDPCHGDVLIKIINELICERILISENSDKCKA